MRFHGPLLDDSYKIYGVQPGQGAIAVVRPDGYVGVVAQLPDIGRIEKYLGGCLRRV
jgi:phenol 2-monooxygenase